MKLLIPLVVKSDKRNKMLGLLEQNLLEHRALHRADNTWPTYAQISAPVLLMSGGKTGIGWTDLTTKRLSEVLPNSAVVRFDRLNHFGIDAGNPALVAKRVSDFFRTDVVEADQH
jgi:hypothetical protein